MKIIVLHQPFPQGNYKLNETLANILHTKGHEVYLLEQLNGAPYPNEFAEELKSINPDVIYFEMLDVETFKAIEELKCKKILLYASRGILPDFTSICDYKHKWFDHILTNSKELHEHFIKNDIDSTHFQYYFNCLTDLTYEEKYNHDCVFLGMGFARLSDPNYKLEQDLFFSGLEGVDFKIYGNGWPSNFDYYAGLLPANDIGHLYGSAKSAIGIIGSGQRSNGMINNRYTEMMFSKVPIVSLNYETIDWGEAGKYINFVDNKSDLINKVKYIRDNPNSCLDNTNKLHTFIIDQSNIFFQKLDTIIRK